MCMTKVSMSHVKKKYDNFILSDINFQAKEKEIIGLIGENGAGKTTLLKSIGGINKIDFGTIKKDFKELGFCFDSIPFPEELNILQLEHVFQNIGINWDTPAFWSYIKALQLPTKTPISNFSKGMKMQLNLCISISHHPDLLLLDEITSGLDPLMRRKVLRLIKKYVDQNDCSVIITTHNLNDVVEICTRFDLLDHGKIILEKNMQNFGPENLEKLFEETVQKAKLGE